MIGLPALMATPDPDRSRREKAAYDEGEVFATSSRWHSRFEHVFNCPNSREAERLYEGRIAAAAAGKRILEIGSGNGENARQLIAQGAAYVRGIDISERFVAEARQHEIPGRLEFAVEDVARPIAGRFDLIVGRAILHHLDYRTVLPRLWRDNLTPGGIMVFMEPLGSNLLMKLFWALATSAHTPDERPFLRRDLDWLAREFAGFELLPINYLSLPVGLASSLLFRQADNPLTRLADRFDRGLARRFPFMAARFRQAIFIIPPPPAAFS